MEDDNDYNLTVAEVAAHYSLSPRTVRTCLKNGALEGVRLSGSWRCCWTDAWGDLRRSERVPNSIRDR